VHFVRTTGAVEVTITWTNFSPSLPADGMVATEGEILLAANKLPDPINDPTVTVGQMIYGASVLAHEITHVIMGDYSFPQSPYPTGSTEPQAYLVEAKVVAELVAFFHKGLAQRILTLPQPAPTPIPSSQVTPKSDLVEQVLALALNTSH
jgi:hypothetical protein